MISVDFAPNEQFDDAITSLKTIFRPWKWRAGREIVRVKNRIKTFFPGSEVFLFLTGRSALYHILRSLRLEEKSEVLVQAFTCEAVILPILASGLKPIYVDIETQTLSMDSHDLKKKITPNCKAIIIQHTFGMTPSSLKDILQISKEHRLFCISDLAHGFQNEETLPRNGAAILSFGRSKVLSSFFGGAVVTKNPSLIKQIKLRHAGLGFPSIPFIIESLLYKPVSVLIKITYPFFVGRLLHTFTRITHLFVPEITSREKRGEYDPLLNKAYPNAFAILLLNQFKKYSKITSRRQDSVRDYKKNLYVHPEQFFDTQEEALLRFPLIVKNRDEFLKKAAKKHIYLGKWYEQVVAPKSIPLNKVFYIPGSCKKAEELSGQIINLPTNISKKERADVIRLFGR